MPKRSRTYDGDEPWNPRPEMIIMEVEARPCLYAPSSPEYGNWTVKNKAWEEVTQSLSEDWDDLTKDEIFIRSKELQAKWKHIRDNFRRECLARRAPARGRRRHRPYRYYQQMRFLEPHLDHTKRARRDSAEAGVEVIDPVEWACVKSEPDDGSRSPTLPASPPHPEPSSTVAVAQPRSMNPPPLAEPQPTGSMNQPDYDEDKAFLVSLAPSLRRMDDESKISAKIDILGVLKKYMFKRE